MHGWLYAAACVGLPIVVGLAMYMGFSAWDRRRRRGSEASALPPVDYSI